MIPTNLYKKASMHHTTRNNLIALTTAVLLLPHPAAALCQSYVPQVKFFSFLVLVVSSLALVVCIVSFLWTRQKQGRANTHTTHFSVSCKATMIVFTVLLAISTSLFAYASTLKSTCDDNDGGLPILDPTSFTECVTVGNPVQESYPRRCTANGVTFTEEVGNTNTDADSNKNIDQLEITNSKLYPNWYHLVNKESNYSIDYPKIYHAQFGSLSNHQVILKDDDLNLIMIWAISTIEEELPATLEDATFLQPLEDFSFAGVVGKKYTYKICDGPACSPDIVSVHIIHNSIHYSIRFYGDKVIDAEEQRIIDSFTVLNTADTADWETYTDEDYMFSFRYPAVWKVEKIKSTPFWYDDVAEEQAAEMPALLVTNTASNSHDGTIIIYYSSMTSRDFIAAYNSDDNPYSTAPGQTTEGQFAGKTVEKLMTSPEGGLPIEWVFFKPALPQPIVISYGDERGGALMKSILSTFTFLADTTSWKTYTNATHGYSVKYPVNWSVTEKFGQDNVRLLPPGVDGTAPSEVDMLGAVAVATNITKDVLEETLLVPINDLYGTHGVMTGIINFDVYLFSRNGKNISLWRAEEFADQRFGEIVHTFTFVQ